MENGTVTKTNTTTNTNTNTKNIETVPIEYELPSSPIIEKKYDLLTITTHDIESAIKQYNKQLHDLSESEEEYREMRKAFNQMRKAIKDYPSYHYDRIMNLVMNDFKEIDHKFYGRFFDIVGEYMTDNGRVDV